MITTSAPTRSTRRLGPPLTVRPDATIVVGPSRQEPIRIGPSTDPMLVIGPAPALEVKPPPRGAWDELGWTRHGHNGRVTYEGYYQIPDRRAGRRQRYAGRIVVGHGSPATYIADPPPQIRRHPKGPCFRLWEAPWFSVEWRHPPGNVDEAILYVEKVLDEALNGR